MEITRAQFHDLYEEFETFESAADDRTAELARLVRKLHEQMIDAVNRQFHQYAWGRRQ